MLIDLPSVSSSAITSRLLRSSARSVECSEDDDWNSFVLAMEA